MARDRKKRFRLNNAVVGFGFIGPNQTAAARSVRSPRLDVDVCVPETVDPDDRFDSIGKPTAVEYGFEPERIYRTVEDAVAAEADNLDGAILASRNNQHPGHAKTFMDAGVAVASEKPLADGIEGAHEMYEAGIKFGLERTCVLPSYTGHAACMEARHIVRSQKKSRSFRFGTTGYWQEWLKKLLAKMAAEEGKDQAAWRKDPNQSGKAGVAGDLVAHLIHQAIFVIDMKIVEAKAERRWFVEGKESGQTEDTCFGQVRFENDGILQFSALQWGVGNKNNNTWDYMFDGLSLGWRQRTPDILYYADDSSPDNVEKSRASFGCPNLAATKPMPAFHSDGWGDGDGRLLNSWGWAVGNCLPDGAELFHPTFKEGRNVVAVVDAMIRSSDGTGDWEKVDWVD